ncbi:hypothetical protein H6769_05515 [Candidatus Peribacteria bacterium]|nr:hypothetical protein [Candidatus Peribacteria bacterium]
MNHITSKSYIATLCYGAFIQQEINLGNGMFLLPMLPVYEECLVNYVAVTCGDFHINVEYENLRQLHGQIKDSRPVTALIVTSELEFINLETLEKQSDSRIYKLKLITSFISGDPIIEFARIIKNGENTFFKMIPFQSRKRQKLFFSKEESESFYKTAALISTNQEYFLSLLHDANHENNLHFKVARYFGVLEALSNKYKQPDLKGSKDRIRHMLFNDITRRNVMNGQIGDVKYSLDPIEISYRFRNNYSHGGEPTYEKFKELMAIEIWEELSKEKNLIINSLQSYCELQLMKEINQNKP